MFTAVQVRVCTLHMVTRPVQRVREVARAPTRLAPAPDMISDNGQCLRAGLRNRRCWRFEHAAVRTVLYISPRRRRPSCGACGIISMDHATMSGICRSAEKSRAGTYDDLSRSWIDQYRGV